MSYKTEQEEFWAGDFGEHYAHRNRGEQILASNNALFSEILSKTLDVCSAIEFGPNIGLNLVALRNLSPNIRLRAVEINKNAIERMQLFVKDVDVINKSVLEYSPDEKFDFVLSRGLLIHINPNNLREAYEKMYSSCGKYICIIEYYNPYPISVNYHGYENKLFKRDFAGEMMDIYSDLRLVDYGFVYHRDANFPQDDINWFLVEKRNT